MTPETSLEELVDRYVYRTQHKLYPVMDPGSGMLRGCVTLDAVRGVPREQWSHTRVADLMQACDELNTIGPATDATRALALLNRTGSTRLMVVDDEGRLEGVVALKDLLGFLAMKVDLEGG